VFVFLDVGVSLSMCVTLKLCVSVCVSLYVCLSVCSPLLESLSIRHSLDPCVATYKRTSLESQWPKRELKLS